MSPQDRRAAERFPVNRDTRCTLAALLVDDLGAVRIQNVSTNGIGLIIGRRVEPGTFLSVTLANSAKSFSRSFLVQVVHVTPHGGSYLIGGTFANPLSYEELTALVM